MWSNISGATGISYTLTNADKNRDIRLMITADDYSGEIISQPVSAVKKTCTSTPVKPSCGWNCSEIVVTNAKKTQEYIVLGNEASAGEPLEENFWSGAQSPSVDGSFYLNSNGTARMNYVYTRVKATDTTLASQASEVGTVFTGSTTYSKGLALKCENTSRSDSEPMQVGDVLKVSVAPVPSNASDFNGVKGNQWTTNGGATAYTSATCTTTCASNPNTYYSVVYFKLNSQKNNCLLKANCTNSIGQDCMGSLTLNIADSSGKYLLDDILIPDMPALMAGRTVKNVPFETVPANASLDNISFYNGGSNYKGPVITIDKTNKILTFDLSKSEPGTYSKELKRKTTDITSKSFTITENTVAVEDIFFNIETFQMSPDKVWNTYFTLNVVPTGANYNEITLTSSNPSLVSVKKGTIVRDSELYCTADINITGAAQGGENVFITATAANGKSAKFVVKFSGGEPPVHIHSYEYSDVFKATANKLGYTRHTCICGDYYDDTFKAPTGKPAGVKCAARTAAAEKISWNKTTGASGYQVQISNAAGNKWATYKNVKANSYVFTKLASGSNYKFRVRFYIKAADGKNYFSNWSAVLASPTLPKATKLASVAGAKKAFTAKWGKVAGVTGYQLQYSTSAKFAKPAIKTVKGAGKNSFAVKSLKGNTKYYVRVRTYKTIGGKNYFSTWSGAKTVKTK